jgi:hypothetical protein
MYENVCPICEIGLSYYDDTEPVLLNNLDFDFDTKRKILYDNQNSTRAILEILIRKYELNTLIDKEWVRTHADKTIRSKKILFAQKGLTRQEIEWIIDELPGDWETLDQDKLKEALQELIYKAIESPKHTNSGNIQKQSIPLIALGVITEAKISASRLVTDSGDTKRVLYYLNKERYIPYKYEIENHKVTLPDVESDNQTKDQTRVKLPIPPMHYSSWLSIEGGNMDGRIYPIKFTDRCFIIKRDHVYKSINISDFDGFDEGLRSRIVKNEADLFFEGDRSISNPHAAILFDGERYFIVDLGSTNRTHIINKKVLFKGSIEEIFDGDVFRVGDTYLKFSSSKRD